jgi:hypothetical protein
MRACPTSDENERYQGHHNMTNSAKTTRRTFLAQTAAVAATAACLPKAAILSAQSDSSSKAINVGTRRELFIDDALVERLVGKADRRLGQPQPQEIAITHDAPWEGSGSGYHSLFEDNGRYRMYYKAWHLDVSEGKLRTNAHPLYLCYAESDDGLTWHKPDLGLHEFRGSKANNIVLVPGQYAKPNIDPGHAAVFKDDNPAAHDDARYKAIVRSSGPHGLLPLKSHDGLHWTAMSDEPVITDGAFDSQNLAFWDGHRQEYRAYWRYFTAGTTSGKDWKPSGHRAIRTARSKDFLSWTDQADLSYVDSPSEQLYTNQVKPYYRAPHLLIGFPTRYVDRGWSDSMRALPEREHRQARSAAGQRYGTAVTEALVMASRDGVSFKRWNEAFLRPGIEREGAWNYGQQYLAWHLVETKSSLPDAPPELSLYATESYWTGDSSRLRRYTLRIDGFVSIHAPSGGGEVVTRPLTFSGKRLSLNFSSSAAGGLRVELQTPDGEPIEGFRLEECHEVFGDSLDRHVSWKTTSDVGQLAGKPVRLRIELKDADLYSFCFTA